VLQVQLLCVTPQPCGSCSGCQLLCRVVDVCIGRLVQLATALAVLPQGQLFCCVGLLRQSALKAAASPSLNYSWMSPEQIQHLRGAQRCNGNSNIIKRYNVHR